MITFLPSLVNLFNQPVSVFIFSAIQWRRTRTFIGQFAPSFNYGDGYLVFGWVWVGLSGYIYTLVNKS
jgi:hypothetical protein